MCGRYSLIADIGELQERFGFDGSELTHALRYNVAPTQMALTSDQRQRKAGFLHAVGTDSILGQERIRRQSHDKRPRGDGRRNAQLPHCVTETTVPGSGRWLLRVAGERLQQEAHEDHDGIG